ncbi:TetR/AcrR family transcriptional regulator [Tessaracoccus terricola]
MARASAAEAARTAGSVLECATSLFRERGFSKVSLDDVAKASGVTRGAVYHHYGSKLGLFLAVADGLQKRVAEAVVAAAEAAGSDPRKQLSAGSHAFLETITGQDMVQVLMVDGPAVVGWQEWRRLDSANSVTHLREVLASTGTPTEVLDAMTAQLSGAMNEAALWVAQHPDAAAARAQAHQALQRLLDAAVGGFTDGGTARSPS